MFCDFNIAKLLGLRSRPRWGSLQRSPIPLAGREGPSPTSTKPPVKWDKGKETLSEFITIECAETSIFFCPSISFEEIHSTNGTWITCTFKSMRWAHNQHSSTKTMHQNQPPSYHNTVAPPKSKGTPNVTARFLKMLYANNIAMGM